MRFLKFLFFLIIVVLIFGGAVYAANQMGFNWSNVGMIISNIIGGGGGHDQHQGHGAGAPGTTQMASPFNNQAAINKDKLTQAMTSLSQAMEIITTDPYSQITMPGKTAEMQRETVQSNVNVTPQREGVNINVTPGNPQTRGPDLTGGASVVFDQSKLEQLHNGIFKFSQANILLQELNNDLADQSILTEANPPNEQTYIMRYNLTLQNRNKINQANRLLQDAMILVNVNPYAPREGYVYNAQKMQQLHTGISELAKSALTLSRLSEDFNQQMLQISAEARMSRAQAGQNMQNMSNMQHNTGAFSLSGSNWFTLIIGLVIVLGILAIFRRLFSSSKISQ